MVRKYVCLHSLSEPPIEPMTPTMSVYLDNCAKDKTIVKFLHVGRCWFRKVIFKDVFVSFLLIGHMYDDIDTSFSSGA